MQLFTGCAVRYALPDNSTAFALVTNQITDPGDDTQSLDLRIVLPNGNNRVDNNVQSFRKAGGPPYWFFLE